MANYIELNEENFDTTLSEGVSLVDFWAPWCGPCRMLAPIIDGLAKDYNGKANICKVNTDENQTLSVKLGIRSIPTMLIYKDGVLLKTIVGVKPKAELSEIIDELL